MLARWSEFEGERVEQKQWIKKGMRLKYMFMNFNIQNGALCFCFWGVAIIGERTAHTLH